MNGDFDLAMSEFDKMQNLYDRMFEDGFPSIPLLDEGPEKCVEIIKDCLAQKKNVEELGYYLPPGDDVCI